MRKELTILACCLAIVTCVGFCVGIYGKLESSKVTKPIAVEDTEIDIYDDESYDDLAHEEEPGTEYEVNTVDNSEYLEEYIAERESESAERAEEISEDFGDSISIYTIADIPVDSEEDYMYMSDALGSDVQAIAGRDDPPLYIHAIACYFKEDMINVRSITDNVQGVTIFSSDIVPSSALYFSDGNRVLAVWLDTLYVYSYDCTQEITGQFGDIMNLMPQ